MSKAEFKDAISRRMSSLREIPDDELVQAFEDVIRVSEKITISERPERPSANDCREEILRRMADIER